MLAKSAPARALATMSRARVIPPASAGMTIACRVTVTQQGEPILHRMYGGELRVNRPLPPKKPGAAKPKPASPAVAKKPTPLSRLEQLRQQKTTTLEKSP